VDIVPDARIFIDDGPLDAGVLAARMMTEEETYFYERKSKESL